VPCQHPSAAGCFDLNLASGWIARAQPQETAHHEKERIADEKSCQIVRILPCFLSATAVLLASPAQLAAQADDLGTAFVPAPRSLRQRLVRAQQAIEERRFGDAVAELGKLLAEEETGDDLESDIRQDYFLDRFTPRLFAQV